MSKLFFIIIIYFYFYFYFYFQAWKKLLWENILIRRSVRTQLHSSWEVRCHFLFFVFIFEFLFLSFEFWVFSFEFWVLSFKFLVFIFILFFTFLLGLGLVFLKCKLDSFLWIISISLHFGFLRLYWISQEFDWYWYLSLNISYLILHI